MEECREALIASGLTVGGLFADRTLDHAQAPALQHDGHVMAYAVLGARVWRLANALMAMGLERGDRIAVLSENRREFIEVLLGAARIGVAVACQNWRQSDMELAHCLTLVSPRLVFCSSTQAQRAEALVPEKTRTFVFGEGYESLLAQASDAMPPDAAQPEDILTILYTSGTTGLPKGAAISHRAMIARSCVNALDTPVARDDAFIAWSPLFHMGAADLTFGTLMQGGKVIVMPGFDADTLAELIRTEKIGDLTIVPGIIDRLVDAMQRGNVTPRSIRMCGAMADLVPPHVLADLTARLGAPYRNTFGSTETGAPPASRGLIAPGVVPVSLSKTQSSLCRIRLVDEDDNPVPVGETGEITMRGPTLFSGYWNAPHVNQTEFRGGWFHGGDLFRRNMDGTLDFVDRRKYLIKSGGENIYPAEIERAIMAIPHIDEAVVVRTPDPKWGEVPVAFVVTSDPGITHENIIASCREKIAGYKIPKQIHFVTDDRIPRSVSGKVQRHMLENTLTAGGLPT